MLGFGSLGFGQLPNPDQRMRLDAGDIETGRVRFGNGMFGGSALPAAVTSTGTDTYRIVIERRRCRR
jgi:hypothetical protein